MQLLFPTRPPQPWRATHNSQWASSWPALWWRVLLYLTPSLPRTCWYDACFRWLSNNNNSHSRRTLAFRAWLLQQLRPPACLPLIGMALSAPQRSWRRVLPLTTASRIKSQPSLSQVRTVSSPREPLLLSITSPPPSHHHPRHRNHNLGGKPHPPPPRQRPASLRHLYQL